MSGLRVRLAAPPSSTPTVLALPVEPADGPDDRDHRDRDRRDRDHRDDRATLLAPALSLDGDLVDELTGLLAGHPAARHDGAAGSVVVLPRPGREPATVVLVGVGDGTETDWRTAGAAVTRACADVPAVTFALPADTPTEAVAGAAEGLMLASYRFKLGADPEAPALAEAELVVDDPRRHGDALHRVEVVAGAIRLARDWINTPSDRKSPQWLADQMVAATSRHSVKAVVRDERRMAKDGFGGVLAVGEGSSRPPRFVELSWAPRGAKRHVVLVGKGITFDTGGISLKPREGMLLMKKDMGGAATIVAALAAAAELKLPIAVTALAPLAENALAGYRPGDVVTHWGGRTTEVLNTDAEGRMVLADALAYAAEELAPDVLIDVATLTGAQTVALGKRTAAVFGEDDALVEGLIATAGEAGELAWRMPLESELLKSMKSDVADLTNIGLDGEAGAGLAAAFLREFTGEARDRWIHVDIAGPSWTDKDDGPLTRGATGWGVRTLVRWLGTLADD